MKKIFALSLLFVVCFSACAFAAEVGILGKLITSEETFSERVNKNEDGRVRSFVFDGAASVSDLHYHFYDSLTALQLALNKGEVDAIFLPDCLADFMLASEPSYKTKGVMTFKNSMVLSFGFMDKNTILQHMFNNILSEMERDGTLGNLIMTYVNTAEATSPKKVTLPEFEGAAAIKIALTGDFPPIDYVAPDGTPAGFNTAVLAEVAKRLKMNVEVVQVEANARAVALTSGRADCTFWFEGYTQGSGVTYDAPEGLIFSKPYYNWHRFIFVGK